MGETTDTTQTEELSTVDTFAVRVPDIGGDGATGCGQAVDRGA